MLTNYIQAAMRHATFEILEDDGTIYGEIPLTEGVWANAETLNACIIELREVLEDWIFVGIRFGHAFPEIDGIRLEQKLEVA